jgi:hypothetical protein
MRRSRVDLRLRMLLLDDHPSPTQAHMQLLAQKLQSSCAPLRIDRLDSSECGDSFASGDCMYLTATHWNQILSHPTLQSLRVLHLRATRLDDETLRLLSSLPSLHTLELHTDFTGQLDLLLPSLPHLTCLQLGSEVHQRNNFTLVTQCAALTDLRLTSAGRLASSHLQQLFAAPMMQQTLQSLRMARLNLKSAPLSLDGMRALHTLDLTFMHGLDCILPALATAPALRRLLLVVQPARPNEGSFPSAVLLARLLAAAPDLHCSLQMELGNSSLIQQQITMAELRLRYRALVASQLKRPSKQFEVLAMVDGVAIVAP